MKYYSFFHPIRAIIFTSAIAWVAAAPANNQYQPGYGYRYPPLADESAPTQAPPTSEPSYGDLRYRQTQAQQQQQHSNDPSTNSFLGAHNSEWRRYPPPPAFLGSNTILPGLTAIEGSYHPPYMPQQVSSQSYHINDNRVSPPFNQAPHGHSTNHRFADHRPQLDFNPGTHLSMQHHSGQHATAFGDRFNDDVDNRTSLLSECSQTMPEVQPSSRSMATGFQCNICGQTTEQQHTHKRDGQWVCPFSPCPGAQRTCMKTFSRVGHLQYHINSVRARKPDVAMKEVFP